jgi:GNAT superfamily N-acetyltransferase
MQPTITMTETPEPHVREAIVGPLIVFNNSRASQPENYRPLVIILSDPDTGGILGGLWAETNFAHLHIDLLFVPETLRGSGLGRQMLLQAEREAKARDCRGAWLDTYSFQARGAPRIRCIWHSRRLSAGSESYLSAQDLYRGEPRLILTELRRPVIVIEPADSRSRLTRRRPCTSLRSRQNAARSRRRTSDKRK